MERRRSKRIVVSYGAELISKTKNCSATISNLSERGIGIYVSYSFEKCLKDYPAGSEHKVKFHPVPGEILYLNCLVKWTQKTPPHGLTTSIGMEILNQSLDKSKYFI